MKSPSSGGKGLDLEKWQPSCLVSFILAMSAAVI